MFPFPREGEVNVVDARSVPAYRSQIASGRDDGAPNRFNACDPSDTSTNKRHQLRL